MMDSTGIEDFLPAGEVEVFDHGRYEESIQPLLDLGFLRRSPQEGEIAAPEDFRQAVRQWRREVLALGLLDQDDLANGGHGFVNPEEVLSSQELKLLHELTGFDGSFLINSDIHIGQQDLISRVVIYRLDILDLVSLAADLPIDQQVIRGIEQLEAWLGLKSRTRTLNLIGDIPELVSLMRSLPAFSGRIAYFKFSALERVKRQFSIEKGVLKANFQKQMRETMPKDAFKDLNRKLFKKAPDDGILEAEAGKDINCFLLRLLQVNQWIHGYYLGKLDTDIGPITFSSFLEITQSEVKAGNISFKHFDFMVYAGNDIWLLNIHYFFQRSFIFKAQAPVMLNELMARTSLMIAELDEEQRQNVEQNLRSAWRDINKEASHNLKQQKGLFSRVYLGVKSTLNAIWTTLQEVFAFLRQKATEFMEKAGHIIARVKYLAKLLYHEIREGLRQYVRGMQFLFGNRKIETGNLTTKFDFDADAFLVVEGSHPPEALRQHAETVKDYADSLYFTLTLTGKVIHFALSVSRITGPMLLMNIGIIFKNYLKELLERKALRIAMASIRIGY